MQINNNDNEIYQVHRFIYCLLSWAPLIITVSNYHFAIYKGVCMWGVYFEPNRTKCNCKSINKRQRYLHITLNEHDKKSHTPISRLRNTLKVTEYFLFCMEMLYVESISMKNKVNDKSIKICNLDQQHTTTCTHTYTKTYSQSTSEGEKYRSQCEQLCSRNIFNNRKNGSKANDFFLQQICNCKQLTHTHDKYRSF